MTSAQTDPSILKNEEVEQRILYFLKMNESLVIGVGEQYYQFLKIINEIINKIYLYYSKEVDAAVKEKGKNVLNYVTVKNMRAIKKQVIRIYINYLQKCNNLNEIQGNFILNSFIFPLGNLLKDFMECQSETKEQ
jgi:DNA replicative helicase MCM subunit Mcm2 (Cdc46/Mcm family)